MITACIRVAAADVAAAEAMLTRLLNHLKVDFQTLEGVLFEDAGPDGELTLELEQTAGPYTPNVLPACCPDTEVVTDGSGTALRDEPADGRAGTGAGPAGTLLASEDAGPAG